MRITFFLTFFCTTFVFAGNSYSQKARVTINQSNARLESVLEEIENQTDYLFLYNGNQIDVNETVSVKVKNTPVSQVLDKIFDDTPVNYVMEGLHIILTTGNETQDNLSAMQTIPVLGTVTDIAGEPLAGVSIAVKGSSERTITDADGKFLIQAPGRNSVLVFSYIGFATQEMQAGNRKNIIVVMSESTQVMDEVVVTALGMKRAEKALAYATQKIEGDQLNKVKGVNVASSLTGRIAGLQINNSTEFLEDPGLRLRGESGVLLVIDGVPYNHMNLRDINQDDIQDINILKGATASALYGARGGNGAIMVTTKKGVQKGFTFEVNTSDMFYAGELSLPKNQTSYSSGQDGKYNHIDYVWGDKLDIGRVAEQWDPITKEWRWMELTSKGKNNFRDFLQFSMISNTTLSVSQRGENGGIRSSLSYLYDKAQYPNQKYQRFNYTLSGDMKLGDKVTVESSLGLSKRMAPNIAGAGSSENGYVYNILMWTGPEYRLADYKDYWVVPHEKQNWHYSKYYDNPWMSAYECLQSIDENKVNGMFSVNYQPFPYLKVMVRSGLDLSANRGMQRNPLGVNGWRKWTSNVGAYSEEHYEAWSLNNDLIANFDKRFGNFSVNALAGGTIFYIQNGRLKNATKSGLTIPGFYSLLNSKESVTVSTEYNRKQMNSLYGNLSLGYKSAFFVDVSGRNDWTSTLPKEEASYFYPSVGGSIVLSELFPLPDWTKFWKLRGSWTVSKSDLGIYAINQTYAITLNAWDGLNSADYPEKLRGAVKPITNRTYELGTSVYFLENNRLKMDFAYYNKLRYDDTREVDISPASGFKKMLINTQEQFVRKGFELTVDAVPVSTRNFKWNVIANWSKSNNYYARLDETFSSKEPWVQTGNRTDLVKGVDFQRDPQGNIVHENGLPVVNSGSQILLGYSDPDWIWGLTNTFTYKQLTLSFSFDGRVGGKVLNELDRYSWANGSNPASDNQWRYDEVVNGLKNYVGGGVRVVSGSVTYDAYGRITEDTRVFEPNTTQVSYQAYIKRWSGTNSVSAFYQDITFLKLRELSLNYDIPYPFARKLGAKKASVALVGQNLLLWTKEFKYSDPDKGLGGNDLPAPSVRYLGVNLNFTF
jgi:TonB-linked SusC/RagA family outer membrane protein